VKISRNFHQPQLREKPREAGAGAILARSRGWCYLFILVRSNRIREKHGPMALHSCKDG
jgi:hypothetical protein